MMDDEEIICDVTSEMVALLGYSMTSAPNGTTALDLYKHSMDKNNPFDVVIMDLTVPGEMGGKETIKKLLEIHPKAKVIVASGYTDDHVMANYEDYGFSGRLVKPFQMKDLKNELEIVLQM